MHKPEPKHKSFLRNNIKHTVYEYSQAGLKKKTHTHMIYSSLPKPIINHFSVLFFQKMALFAYHHDLYWKNYDSTLVMCSTILVCNNISTLSQRLTFWYIYKLLLQFRNCFNCKMMAFSCITVTLSFKIYLHNVPTSVSKSIDYFGFLFPQQWFYHSTVRNCTHEGSVWKLEAGVYYCQYIMCIDYLQWGI